MRFAHYDIRTLMHDRSIRVVNDHMDRPYPYSATARSSTGWSASAIADLLVERNRTDPGYRDGRVTAAPELAEYVAGVKAAKPQNHHACPAATSSHGLDRRGRP